VLKNFPGVNLRTRNKREGREKGGLGEGEGMGKGRIRERLEEREGWGTGMHSIDNYR
jgi:hypothetical protein